jgi:hypothetical protein
MGDLNSIKAIIRSIAISCSDKNGISIDKLSKDYKELEGHYIPFKKVGFSSLQQLLSGIRDTVYVSIRISFQKYIFFPSNSAMPKSRDHWSHL